MSEMRAHLCYGAELTAHQVQQDEDVQCNGRSRPVSLYDNFKDSATMPPCVTSMTNASILNQVTATTTTTTSAVTQSDNNNRVNTLNSGSMSKTGSKVTGAATTSNIAWNMPGDKSKEKDCERAPSMANCLSTTVPVNLAASKIAGRHTPTRSSLRHSRMIVMHRNGNIPRKSRPPLLRRRKLASSLAALQTILGVVITSLSLWLLLWAPNLPFLDNPYWSGMPLLFSGSFGVCLLCCFKKEYPGMSPGFCLTLTKIISVLLAVVATITCLVACVTSAMHLIKLNGLECTPARVRNATCACRPRSELASPADPVLKYVDLNCPEVEGVLTILLLFSSTCNAIGAIIAGWYCYLHWSTRDKRPEYIKVRTSLRSSLDTRPIYNPNLNRR
ncbi:uncharacterized protein [Chelonus insularis]|uniref:uncharacterized protein n=1 Tax=Chelonus insularis TaxID=460826 RepID=UPI00158E0CD8|nr:uncharacterized protein LOC118072174 [Chelonus insularis]